MGSDKRAGGGFCKDHTDPTRPPWTRQIGDGYDEISPSEHDTWTQSDSRSILFHRDPRPNLFFSSHELYGVNRHHIATVSRYIPTQDWVTFPLSYAEVQLGYGETSLWARRSIRFHDFLIAHETVDRRRLWLLNDDASPSIS